MPAEITTRRGSEVMTWSDDAVVDHVLQGLRQRSLVPEGADHVFTCVERFDQAYVVYTNGYARDVEIARQWFEDQRMVFTQKVGSHQYVNVDGCLRQSIDLARRMGVEVSDDGVRARFAALGEGVS